MSRSGDLCAHRALGSVEDLFGLRRLGYARTVDGTFGADVCDVG